jgi:hypothetical protein
MRDFDAFDDACKQNDSYITSFVQSMGLMIGEFYDNFPVRRETREWRSEKTGEHGRMRRDEMT